MNVRDLRMKLNHLPDNYQIWIWVSESDFGELPKKRELRSIGIIVQEDDLKFVVLK